MKQYLIPDEKRLPSACMSSADLMSCLLNWHLPVQGGPDKNEHDKLNGRNKVSACDAQDTAVKNLFCTHQYSGNNGAGPAAMSGKKMS